MSELHNHQVGLLISGSGTTAIATCLNIAAYKLSIDVPVMFADRTSANLEIVDFINAQLGWDIKPVLVDREAFPGGATEKKWALTDEQSERILQVTRDEGVDFLSQLGFLSMTRGVLLEEMGEQPGHTMPEQGSILNNHPGDTTDTRGLYGDAVHKRSYELERAAFTIHGVNADYDQGMDVARYEVPVLPAFTDWRDVKDAVMAVEKANTAVELAAFGDRRVAYLASQI